MLSSVNWIPQEWRSGIADVVWHLSELNTWLSILVYCLVTCAIYRRVGLGCSRHRLYIRITRHLTNEPIWIYPSEYFLNIDNNHICINIHLFSVIIAVYPQNRQKHKTGQAGGRKSECWNRQAILKWGRKSECWKRQAILKWGRKKQMG